ncbi:MAG: ABC transporter substrate-binding protein [Myxococcales bacterium]|nr:ABC transporter substrate-binding protein [Myxococcales bacterium]
MSPRWFSRGRLLAPGSTIGLVALGCSLLYELDSAQCSTNADCESKGPSFAGTECVASLCVTPAATGGSSGGSGGSGEAGSRGAECVEHMDCVNARHGNPHLCREGSCVPLTLARECPLVLGLGKDNENLKRPDPIVFGAYSYVDPIAPRLSVPTLNYELAINEVNERGGLSGGTGGTRRPFIAVVCNGRDSPDLDASLGHLVDELQVPAILASLHGLDLLEAFETKGLPNNVFFLSPLEADNKLRNLPDNGLLWHMLTSSTELAPAYLPLLERSERWVRAQLELSEDDPIRVALVDARVPFLTDIVDYLVKNARFNGKSLTQNGNDGNLRRVTIDSNILVSTPDIAEAFGQLQEFKPHVVLAIASGEFAQLRDSYEAGLPPSEFKPVYLVSPYLFGDPAFAGHPSASRTLGVNFAGAEDRTLYEAYLLKLQSNYGSSGLLLEGSENFYDAAYYLMYAIAGAGNPPRLTGREVALGMARLVDGPLQFEVGQRIADAIDTLESTASAAMTLHGTMGPPTFNTSTGVRRGLPSVYCIEGGTFVQDAMTYDPVSQELEGEPCIEGF